MNKPHICNSKGISSFSQIKFLNHIFQDGQLSFVNPIQVCVLQPDLHVN